jgi:hypothetical protein
MLLSAVYKNADIMQFFTFRQRRLLAGDLNITHPVWKNIVSKASGSNL